MGAQIVIGRLLPDFAIGQGGGEKSVLAETIGGETGRAGIEIVIAGTERVEIADPQPAAAAVAASSSAAGSWARS